MNDSRTRTGSLINADYVCNLLKAEYGEWVRFYDGFTRKQIMSALNLRHGEVSTSLRLLKAANVVQEGRKQGNEKTYRFYALAEYFEDHGTTLGWDDGKNKMRGRQKPKNDVCTTPSGHQMWDDDIYHITKRGDSYQCELIDASPNPNEEQDNVPEPDAFLEQSIERTTEACMNGDWGQLKDWIASETAV